jgi:hypothetical protein
MPVKTVVQILDSVDGKELDPDTKPLRIQLDRKAWELYLSDQNREKLQAALERFTKNEPEMTAQAFADSRKTKPTAKADPEQLARIREWARGHGFDVAPRGRVAQHIQDAYHAAGGS